MVCSSLVQWFAVLSFRSGQIFWAEHEYRSNLQLSQLCDCPCIVELADEETIWTQHSMGSCSCVLVCPEAGRSPETQKQGEWVDNVFDL